jgi:acyl-coenzyme A synthetase/AMP-(fatty) acid ligase
MVKVSGMVVSPSEIEGAPCTGPDVPEATMVACLDVERRFKLRAEDVASGGRA